MRWLVRRVLALWLLLLVLCGMVTLIIRRDRVPDRLRTLGFDVCDGTLCFGNIRSGMRWADAQALPNASSGSGGNYLAVASDWLTPAYLELWPSEDGQTVRFMRLGTPARQVPLMIGDMATYLGRPCRILFDANSSDDAVARIQYQYGVVYLQLVQDATVTDQFVQGELWLKPESHITGFWLDTSSDTESCSCGGDEETQFCWMWQGFTTMQAYRSRMARRGVAP
jgi:hypothetical protein